MSKVVIVESPTKAKTIKDFLPRGYKVTASMGHIRDLPQSASEIPAKVKKESWATLGVNYEENFEPLYVIPKDKKKVVSELKELLKDADELLLATDEDREGESISWHLKQVLKPKVPVKRMVFHEITKEAIKASLKNFREIDEDMVHAQETRRILDRLVGYTLSPLLWKKIAAKLSAGRVQSVAVRLLVIRERARRAFHKGGYWDLSAKLVKGKQEFPAQLSSVDGVRVASGQDFDPDTGKIAKGKKVLLLDETGARELSARISSSNWEVISREERKSVKKPAPPFTTSTLQQEANRKLRFSAKDTSRVAQNLYEQGFITYMRTDSVNLSDQAVEAARNCVEDLYGDGYLSPEPRQYTTKSKGAQEAHEAIRPAGSSFRTPKQTGLTGRELALYDLIWKRTVATQMAEAKQTHINLQFKVEDAVFRSSGKKIDFPGFFRAYVEGSDDPEANLEDKEILLPDLDKGDSLDCSEVKTNQHETKPPARFTEASLVKMLESEGIGRPSTYASIISTIIDRGYVQNNKGSLTPTFTAFAVIRLLEKHFPDLVNTDFTAKMENNLDEISAGNVDWLPYLKDFFSGDTGLSKQVEGKLEEISPSDYRALEFDGLNAKVCIGRFGPFLEVEQEGKMVTASIPNEISPADLDKAAVEEIIRAKSETAGSLGAHPETGEPIYVLNGNYGPYVQLGDASEDKKIKPKRTPLPKKMKIQDVDLEFAIGLLSLPRHIGDHPETGGKIQAGIGPYGPYIVYTVEKTKDYRSLKEDDVTTIGLERSLEILAQPKRGRGARTATPLKELGGHPDDGEPVNVYNGPYGHYVKHGKVNASLTEDITAENVTLEQAVELLNAKATKPKKKRTYTKRAK